MTAESRPSLAVVLFTDLVGSTAQRASLGEERADELRKLHDRILSERVEAHAGHIVKGLGDGLMAVFAAASDALAAAVGVQQAICVHNQRSDSLAPLSVRVGLSVGDVSWESGECFGTPVVEAARLVAVAEGGEIVCSEYVRVMARGRGQHRFRSLGPLVLKGLPEPVDACEVQWQPPAHYSVDQLPFPRPLVVRSPLAFVGRDEEVATAERHLGTSRGLSVVWLVGEPGIGKTRLAAELARRAYDRGCDVLFGRCDEELAVPFQPFLAALGHFVSSTPTEALPERLGRQPAELARLLPELAAAFPGFRPPLPADPGTEGYRLFEAVRSWVTVAAATRPLLLVVDDLHWADAATLGLLRHLVSTAGAANLAILGTIRDTEPGTEAAQLLDDFDAPVRRIPLAGLGPGGITRLIEAVTGRNHAWDAPALARHIEKETGGNPLFVTAILAGLGSRGAGSDLPGDVAAAVRRRVRRLPAATKHLLRMASVIGLEFDLRVVGRVLAIPVAEALEAVDAAVRAHLVEETAVNRYRFAHAVVRSVLRTGLGASRAAHYHGLIGEALEALHDHPLDEHVEALAYHYGEAVCAGIPPERALHYTMQAAERAAAQYANQTAADRYRRALQLLEVLPGEDERRSCEVMVALGAVETGAGNFEEAEATLRRAAAKAEAAGYPDLAARAACQFERASTLLGLPGEDAAELLRRAAGQLGVDESALRAGVLTGLARALAHTAAPGNAASILDEAITLARRVGDPRTLGEALIAVSQVRTGPSDIHVRLESAAEAREIAQLLGNSMFRSEAAAALAGNLLEAGEMRGLKDAVSELEDVLKELAFPWARFGVTLLNGTIALTEGRLDDAEDLARKARQLGRFPSGPDFDGLYGLQMFGIRREQGRLAEVAPVLRTMFQLGPDPHPWRPGLVALYAELGMIAEARAELRSLVTPDGVLLPADSRQSLSLSYLAEAATFLGEHRAAKVLYGELLPYANVCVVTFNSTCYGPASRYLGMLATAFGAFDEAQAHFEDALVRCDRLESPTWVAHTQYQFARLLLTRRRRDDVAQAGLLAQAAREIAARFGMRALEERVGRLLESGVEWAGSGRAQGEGHCNDMGARETSTADERVEDIGGVAR